MLISIIRAVAWLSLGVVLASSWVYFHGKHPSESDAHVLTAEIVKAALKREPARVPTAAVGTGERSILADEPGEKVLQVTLASPPVPMVFLSAQVEYAVDVESNLILSTDPERKVVTVSLPQPHVVNVSEQPESLTLTFAPSTEAEINPIKNEAVLMLQKRGASVRCLDAAKALYAARIESIAQAFGYSSQVVWGIIPSGGERHGPL